jgi:hypothetical protein
MEIYRPVRIGSCLELTINQICNSSIEELIDQGRRFSIVKEDSEEEDKDDDD